MKAGCESLERLAAVIGGSRGQAVPAYDKQVHAAQKKALEQMMGASERMDLSEEALEGLTVDRKT